MKTAGLLYFLIIIGSSYPADFTTCASIAILQSCEEMISIFSSGTTNDANLYTGATGVMIKTSKLSCNIGPPNENE